MGLRLGIVGLALLLAGCGGGGQTVKTVTVSAGSTYSAPTSYAEPTAAAAPPLASDFKINVVVTKKKCFGSAGCNYHYSIEPQFVGVPPVSRKFQPAKIVFTVSGGDQEQVGNFKIDADGIMHFDSDTTTRGEDGTVFTAAVTQVIPLG